MKSTIIKMDLYGDVVCETRGVNSNILMHDVIEYAIETLNNTTFFSFDDIIDREEFVGYLEHFFNILIDTGYVDQYDIVFDLRNNTQTNFRDSKFKLELKFKQKHCLNTTSLKMKINGKD